MTRSQRWGWGLLTVLIALSIVFLLMLEADASGYNCQGEQHCQGTTTTTVSQETTSTESLPTTTTNPPVPSTTSTSTTLPASTTTVPIDNTTTTAPAETVWAASAECRTLVAEWDEGISRVDVWMRDPVFGDFGPADGLTSFTTSGQVIPTGINAEFLLIPIPEPGWVAVPDQITLHTVTCTPHPSTTPPITDPSAPPELPLTGASTKALIAVAAALSTLGFMAVKEAGRE